RNARERRPPRALAFRRTRDEAIGFRRRLAPQRDQLLELRAVLRGGELVAHLVRAVGEDEQARVPQARLLDPARLIPRERRRDPRAVDTEVVDDDAAWFG